MLEVQEQCEGFSTKNEDVENLVGRQEGLMSYSTCQFSLLVRVCPGFPGPPVPSWSPWIFRCVALNPRIPAI